MATVIQMTVAKQEKTLTSDSRGVRLATFRTQAATATRQGLVRLANHLSGTADNPTVVSTALSSPLTLAQGGTGADLSATGPGALVQTSSGAVVTVETLNPGRGGTGVNNGSNALTVPATGTAALLATAQTFTAKQTIEFAGGGDYVFKVENTTAATPYGMLVEEPASASSGYPLLAVSGSGGEVLLRADSGIRTVGIGVSPVTAQQLTVKGASAGTVGLVVDTAASPTADIAQFKENGTVRVAIDEAGNVGVGAASPSEILHIMKDQNAVTRLYIDNNTVGAVASSAFALGTNESAEAGNVVATGSSYNTSPVSAHDPANVANSFNVVGARGGGMNLVAANGSMRFYSGNATTAKMQLDTSGNVGIGTVAPDTELDVVGIVKAGESGGSTAGVLAFVGDYSGVNNYILTLGSLYSSAGTALGYAVKPKSGGSGYVSSTGTNIARSAATLDNTGFHVHTAAAQTAVYDGALTSFTEKLTVTTAGNVGIGTTSPGGQLEVKASSASTVGLVVTSAASPTADIASFEENGTARFSFTPDSVTDGAPLTLDQFDNGTGIGRVLSVERNTNATTPAPSSVRFVQSGGGTGYSIWVDDSADLRIGNHFGVTSAQKGGGTVVGTQTSQRAFKNVYGEGVTPTDALQIILSTPVFEFDYKSQAYNGTRFHGIIAEESPIFAMDEGRVFNPVSAFGYTVQGFKALNERVEQLERIIEQWRGD